MAGLVLPAAASLVDQLDKRVLVILRDGRNLVGVMRSFDQFSNVVLEDAVERREDVEANLHLSSRLIRRMTRRATTTRARRTT